MAYLSLYRRSRPETFGEMTGQEHVSRTLRHALSRGRLAHAYLFCGPRGTGKTTTAKILARAVNCENYPAPEACGSCTPCRNILAGVSIDVVEMDAASNRGIDEIRELRERTRYASGESRFKVYIIDEAHMLTPEACNAFLKTLEEPPSGVIFILATTDPSRLPITIVSRCQRFDFHLLTVSQIRDHLRQIAGREEWSVEDEAIDLISRLAEGSLRDALGLLEQCRAYGEDMITADHVRAVTGVTRAEIIGALIEAVATVKLEEALLVLQQVVFSGRDLVLFLRDLTFFFSRLLLGEAPAASRPEDSYYGFDELLQRYRGTFSREALLDVIELLHTVGGELRHAHHPQFVLEMALIRILRVLHRKELPKRPAGAMPAASPANIDVPESKGAEKTEPAPRDATTSRQKPGALRRAEQETAVSRAATGSQAEHPAVDTAAVPPSETFTEHDWARLLSDVKKEQSSTYNYLEKACSCTLQGLRFTVFYYRDDEFTAARIKENGHRRLVETILRNYYSREISVGVSVTGPAPPGVERENEESKGPVVAEDVGTFGTADQPGYTFDDVAGLFPGRVFNVQEREDPKDERRQNDETTAAGPVKDGQNAGRTGRADR